MNKKEIIIIKTLSKINNQRTISRTLSVGPSSSGRRYLMSKLVSQISNQDLYMITKSPLQQYSNSEIKRKKLSDEIKPQNEYENAIIVFSDNLDSSNSSYIDRVFMRGRQNTTGIYCLSQSHFDIQKRTVRNNSNKTFLFNQTLNDIESIYRDVSGYDIVLNLKN